MMCPCRRTPVRLPTASFQNKIAVLIEDLDTGILRSATYTAAASRRENIVCRRSRGCRPLRPTVDEASSLLISSPSIAGRVRLVAIGDEDIAVLPIATPVADQPRRCRFRPPHLAEHLSTCRSDRAENLLAQLNTILPLVDMPARCPDR